MASVCERLRFVVVANTRIALAQKGLRRELNPGPLAPKARIIPLDQAANETKAFISKARANVKKMSNIAAKGIAIDMPQASYSPLAWILH